MSSSIKETLVMSAAALAVLTANTAMAEADVTVYGKANVSIQAFETKEGSVTTQDNFEVLSNASRMGIKASADVSDSVKAIAQMEFEVNLDDGSKEGDDEYEVLDAGGNPTGDTVEVDQDRTITQRNSYVGLKSDYGTIIAGIHDSPTKLLGKPVDIFSDYKLADIKNVVNGEERIKNAVMYRSPAMAGFSFDAMIAPGEDDGGDNAASDEKDGVADYNSIALTYKWEGLTVGISRDDEIKQDFLANSELVRFVAAYKAKSWAVSALFTQSEEIDSATNKEQEGQILTAYYKIGDWKMKALVGASSVTEDGVQDIDTQQIVVGADYKLSKQMKAFAYVADLTTEQKGSDDEDESTVALGLEYKF